MTLHPELDVARSNFCDVPTALNELRSGRMIIVAEDECSGETCHLVVAAHGVSVDTVDSMQKIAGGLACIAVPHSDLRNVQLPVALQDDFALGVKFGDMRRCDPLSNSSHTHRSLIPLCVGKHGVLRRPGPAECAVDLTRLAGVVPSAILCEVMRIENSGPASTSVYELATKHDLNVFSVVELIRHRLAAESHISLKAKDELKTRYGNFQLAIFESDVFETCAALIKGTPPEFAVRPPLVRIESSTSFGLLHTSMMTCMSSAFHRTLELMYHYGLGVVVFLSHGKHYSKEEYIRMSRMPFFQDDPFVTLVASRPHQVLAAGICAEILRHLSISSIRIVSDKPRRVLDLTKCGISIVDEIAVNERT